MKLLKMMGMVCIASTAFLTACDKDDDNDSDNLTQMDRDFMMKASHGNHAEMDAGGIASNRGDNAGVRTFGSMMVADHSDAQDDLEDLADDWDINIPNEPDLAHKAEAQLLQTLSGVAFDRTYMNAQVRDHQTTIDLYNSELSSTQSQRIKDYINKWLPGVMHHKHMADSLANVVAD